MTNITLCLVLTQVLSPMDRACGPIALSAYLRHRLGIEVSAREIYFILGKPVNSPTTIYDLTRAARYFNIEAEAVIVKDIPQTAIVPITTGGCKLHFVLIQDGRQYNPETDGFQEVDEAVMASWVNVGLRLGDGHGYCEGRDAAASRK
jgi:hypothetical protein